MSCSAGTGSLAALSNCVAFKNYIHFKFMDDVWKKLPYDMVREILKYSDDIDVRIAFKIPPRRIHTSRIWKISYLLNSREGLFYNLETDTLHCFENGVYSNRRPIRMFKFGDLSIFNDEESPHVLEIVRASGSVVTSLRTDSLITGCNVVLKSSQIK